VIGYRLTNAAQEDMDQLLEQGIDDYGVEVAIDYYDKIEKRLNSLVEQPYQYPAVHEIRVGYRRSVCGVHSIYYRIDSEEIVIARILKKQSPLKQLAVQKS
jgi:toxin ParE1/3/4